MHDARPPGERSVGRGAAVVLDNAAEDQTPCSGRVEFRTRLLSGVTIANPKHRSDEDEGSSMPDRG